VRSYDSPSGLQTHRTDVAASIDVRDLGRAIAENQKPGNRYTASYN